MFKLSLSNSPNKKWWLLLAMALSLGMIFIDQLAVAIALPKIQNIFRLSAVSLQWIVNVYLLTLAVFLIIGGRLGDVFQHHRVFLIGLSIFLLASISCAVAPNIISLLISRAIQGFGGALLLPNAAVIVINAFPNHEKGKAMGLYMGSSLLFLPVALIIGGAFTQYLSWRFIFWINLPLSVISFMITYYSTLSEPTAGNMRSINWRGLTILIAAATALVYALMESSNLGYDSPVIISLVCVSLFLFIIFYYLERRSPNATVDLAILNNKLFLCAAILISCMSVSIGLFIFDAIFYQQVLGFRPLSAGILFVPGIICAIFAAQLAGIILDNYGYKLPVLIGLTLNITGLLLNGALAQLQNYWYLLPGIICIGIGTPLVLISINTATLMSMGTRRGIASGILNATRQITNSISLALLTSIIVGSNNYFLSTFIKNHQEAYPRLGLNQMQDLLAHPHIIPAALGVDLKQLNILFHVAKVAFTLAYGIGLYSSAFILLIALFCAVTLFRKINE